MDAKLDAMLKAKAAMTPARGFNLVGVDDFEARQDAETTETDTVRSLQRAAG